MDHCVLSKNNKKVMVKEDDIKAEKKSAPFSRCYSYMLILFYKRNGKEYNSWGKTESTF